MQANEAAWPITYAKNAWADMPTFARVGKR